MRTVLTTAAGLLLTVTIARGQTPGQPGGGPPPPGGDSGGGSQFEQEFELGESDDWIETSDLDPESPAGRLALARRALATGDYERAEYLATQWIEREPRHPLLPEAYLIRGDALMGQHEYYQSLFDYELVARRYAGSDAFITALEREMTLARMFLSGTKRKFLGVRWVSAEGEAEELLIRVQERLPGSHLAEEAALVLADDYFTKRNMTLAAEMYEIFIENFPRSESLSIARRRLVYAHLAAFKGPEHDASGLEEARVQLQRIRAVSPATAQRMGADALLTRIDDSLARKHLEVARWYVRRNDYIGAEYTVRRLLEDHPRSIAARDAIAVVMNFIDRLPPAIVEEAPDYPALHALIRLDIPPETAP